MDYYWIFYAASCFFFFAVGRMHGHKDGFRFGKQYMKACMVKDMRIYPNKWKHYIDKLQGDC